MFIIFAYNEQEENSSKIYVKQYRESGFLSDELVTKGEWAEILKVKPNDAISQCLISIAYGITEDYEHMKQEAEKTSTYQNYSQVVFEYFKRLIKDYPTNANVHFVMGTHWLGEEGNFNKAIEEFEKAAKLNPKFAPAFYQIAVIAEKTSDNSKSLQYAKKAIEADPTFASSYSIMGKVCTKLGRYDNAIESFKKGEKVIKEKDLSNNYILGKIYYDWGWTYLNLPSPNNEMALTMLKKAITLNPQNGDAYNQLGIAYKRKGAYEKAIDCYKKALQYEPEDQMLYFNLGVAYYRNDQTLESKRAFQKAVELDPNSMAGNGARQWLARFEQ